MRVPNGVTAIITGASTGIGKAIALEMATRYKARLAINARSPADLNAVAEAIRQRGGEAITICGDIGQKETRELLVKAATENYGQLNWLINNAGYARPGQFDELTVDDWRGVFEVNFFAPLELTYRVLPEFKRRGAGKIINIASVAGKVAFPGSVCYASSKFALTGFSEGLAAELGNAGIETITVCPGLVRTEFFRKNNNGEDFSAIAEENNIRGWLLRNAISISSEQAANEILQACERGGCHEIVLTGPGKVIERIAGIWPSAAFWLARRVPAQRGSRKARQPR